MIFDNPYIIPKTMTPRKISISFSPQMGEELSSWINRIATANGLSMTDFLGIIFPRDENIVLHINRIIRDITGIPKEKIVRELSNFTDVLFEDLINSSFLREEGAFSNKQLDGEEILHNLIRPNRPCCPLCFADNAIAFHKKDWQLKFNFKCRVHDQIFLDVCPHCEHVVWDNKIDRQHPSPRLSEDFFRYCTHCKKDLGETEKRVESLSEASRQLAEELMDLCAVALATPFKKFNYGKSPPIPGYELLAMVYYFSEKLANEPKWAGLARMISSEIGLPHPVSRHLHDWSGTSQTLFDLCQLAAVGWILGRSTEQLIAINEGNWRVILPVHNKYNNKEMSENYFPKWMNRLFPKDYIHSNLPYPPWKTFEGVWLSENYPLEDDAEEAAAFSPRRADRGGCRRGAPLARDSQI